MKVYKHPSYQGSNGSGDDAKDTPRVGSETTGVSEGEDGGSEEGEGNEDEDCDPVDENEKRYWDVKAKEGVGKVSNSRVICSDSAEKKSQATRDLRLCFKKDVRQVNGRDRAGEYSKICK